MRSILLLILFFYCGASWGQGSGFSFSYTGPTQIIVGQDCVAELDWGHPNTPTASSNLPGGVIVSFNIYSISGGYQIGDEVGGGTVVTVFYQAIDNFGNSALFGFSIAFIDLIPPAFDPLSLPPNLTVNCIGNFPVANVEVSDNCDEQDIVLTVTFTETNNAALCTGGVITRKWVADDDLGNQATFIQTITVLPDNTPPVIANNLMNGSAACTNAMSQYATWLTAQRAAFSATDNGCGVMTLSDNAPSPAIITSFCGDIVVTFTAKDNCNNISTVQRTFAVFNSTPPVINNPAANASGNCNQSNINQLFNSWIGSHGGATATDDCSSVLWSTFPATPTIGATCDSSIFVLFIAGDGCGNFDTTSASFMLTDVTPPTITTDPASIVLSCTATTIDSLLMDWLTTSGHSVANDLCTSVGNLTRGYRISGTELTIEQVLQSWQDSLIAGCRDNVIINGIGINNVLAYLPVQFTYDDACGNEAGEIGYFGITDNGRPVFITQPSDTSFACAESNNWQTVFLDWYNSAGGATFMDGCSQVSVRANMTADSAMQILAASLDTACMQGAGVTIQFTLADECGNLSLSSPAATFSLQDTLAPVLTTPASDLLASCSMNGQLQINNWLDTLGGAVATDGCGALNWAFSWIDTSGVSNTGTPGTGPYPLLATLDCASGLEVIFTVMDVCQNSISDTALFSLVDTVAPVIFLVNDSIHLLCNDILPTDTPSVSDACNGAIVLTMLEVAGQDSCMGQPEVLIRTWTATDECGNSSSAQIFYFRIDSIAPTFELPNESVEFCSVDTLMLINLQDNCDPSPASSSVDIVTGIPCLQMLERTWTVTDACGNSTTALQIFDISDQSPPTILTSPGDYTYTCGTGTLQEAYESWISSVEINDACSDADYFIALPGSYIIDDTSTWPGVALPDSIFVSCPDEFLVEGDLVVFDICGNVLVETISFAVNDTVAPVISCPAVIQVEPDTSNCTGLVQLTAPLVEELCYPDDVSLVLILDGGNSIAIDSTGSLDTVMRVGIHTALWSATDCKGNRGTCVTTIEIIDENAISLTCPLDTVLYTNEITCSDSLWVYPPSATLGLCALGVVELRFEIIGNASPDSMAFEFASDSVLVTFFAGMNEVLLIARDSTGDIDTCRYLVEIRDTISPLLICQSDTAYLHPSGMENVDLSTTSLIFSATDNCDVQTISYDPPFINCNSAGQLIDVTIIASDVGGNSDTCKSQLFVTTQPLFPQWTRGLCDDTLRLFANIPPGPSANYVFNWSGPNGFVSNEENPVIANSDTSFSGTYSLVIQSESGCTSSGSVEVDIQTLGSPLIMLSDDTICTGELIELTTQQYTGNVTYQWYQVNPAGDTIVVESTDPTLLFTLEIPGGYSFFAVVIQDTCISEPGPDVDLEVLAVPVAIIANINLPLCENDTLFLSPSIISDSFNYLWTGPGGFISFEAIPAGIPAIEIDSPAVYYLTVSNPFCTSVMDSVEVIVQTTPATPVIEGDAVVCEGGVFTLTSSSVGNEFLWLDPALNSFLTTQNSLTVVSAQSGHSGEWKLITFVNGCPSDTSNGFFVQIDTAITVQIIADELVCENENIQLSFSPNITGTYTWSGPNGFASDENSPVTNAVAGDYTLFVQTSTGCEDADTITIQVDELPVITGLLHDAGNCVDGTTSVQLWAETSPVSNGNFSFHWSGPGGFISQDSSPVIPDFNAALNGEYVLFIVNGACVSDTSLMVINVVDSPAPPDISGQTQYCFGDTIILSIGSPITGGVYTWSFADTSIIIASPGNLIVPDADADLSGSFTVDVFVDGCISAPSSVEIVISASLEAPAISTPSLICEGDSLVLTSNAPAGAILHWSGPNGFMSNETNPVIFPALPVHSGSYQVSYTLNDCASDSSTIKEINIQSMIGSPQLNIDVSAICIDNPSSVSACIDEGSPIEGGTYTWLLNGSNISEGDMDSCITIDGSLLSGGNNFISAITELNGCVSGISDAVIVQGDEFPSQFADAGIDMQYCPAEVSLLDAVDPSPATGVWTSLSPDVLFSDPTDPSSSIGGLSSGDYTLVWTLSYATCIDYSSDSVIISIIPSPVIVRDTFEVPFGQTSEFIVTQNDTFDGSAFTLQIIDPTQEGNALHAGNGVFRYTPDIGFVGTDMMTYRICSADCPEECGEAIVILLVGSEDDCFTPTLFTPNQDGINDRLIVPCLETERYPDNKIIIFNEWGDAVYTAAPYQNDWQGTFGGESLPVGTYFYIMDFGDGSDVKRSFLVIER